MNNDKIKNLGKNIEAMLVEYELMVKRESLKKLGENIETMLEEYNNIKDN